MFAGAHSSFNKGRFTTCGLGRAGTTFNHLHRMWIHHIGSRLYRAFIQSYRTFCLGRAGTSCILICTNQEFYHLTTFYPFVAGQPESQLYDGQIKTVFQCGLKVLVSSFHFLNPPYTLATPEYPPVHHHQDRRHLPQYHTRPQDLLSNLRYLLPACFSLRYFL